MKKPLTPLIACLLLWGPGLFGQSADEKAVTTAVESLRQAMIDGNKKTLENLCAEELTYGHSSGKIEDKAAFVENLANGNSNFEKITISDQTVRIVDNTAMVRHTLFGELHDNGKDPATLNLSVLLIWQKQKGQWKLLARQSAKLP